MPFETRKIAYECDITYGTNSEFGFDYLRDNMAVSMEGVVQRGHAYAIVDEVDSILIDEARTPLIISGEPETAAKTYYDFARIVKGLEGVPYKPPSKIDKQEEPGRRLHVRREVQDGLAAPARHPRGRARAADRQPLRPAQRPARQPPRAGAEGAGALPPRRRLRRPGRRGEDRRRVHRPDHGRAAAGARACTRRSRPRRACDIQEEHVTMATITLQNYFRLYEKLAGHDRHGQDRGEGVHRDLRPARRRDPDQRDESRATTRTT